MKRLLATSCSVVDTSKSNNTIKGVNIVRKDDAIELHIQGNVVDKVYELLRNKINMPYICIDRIDLKS